MTFLYFFPVNIREILWGGKAITIRANATKMNGKRRESGKKSVKMKFKRDAQTCRGTRCVAVINCNYAHRPFPQRCCCCHSGYLCSFTSLFSHFALSSPTLCVLTQWFLHYSAVSAVVARMLFVLSWSACIMCLPASISRWNKSIDLIYILNSVWA